MPRTLESNGLAPVPAPGPPQFNLTPEQISVLFGQQPKAATMLTADSDIAYHDKSNILVPKGMSMEQLEDIAKKKAAELNKVHRFVRVFQYRPDDGAHAAALVIKRMFGMTVGVDKKTFFGTEPPGYRTIAISHNRTMEVPWGQLEIQALPGAVVEFTATEEDTGPVFVISVKSPKKHADQIEMLFDAVSDELRLNSIYRGKALSGENELKFLDVSRFNPAHIVFSGEVQRHLDAGVFGLLRYTDAARRANLSTKRAVLAHGPYGTGKTSLGMITAQIATENGWTFIKVTAKNANALRQAFHTAKLYEPCVLFIEDIDRYTPRANDKNGIAELLDLFDGVGSKDSKLLVVMTTNHPELVPTGMLRPGRLDYIVEIAGLDRHATERLIRAVIPADLLADGVDFDAVYANMQGFQPAWVRSVASRASELAIARNAGSLSFQLNTGDLIDGAKSLQDQLELMRKSLEGEPVNKLDATLGDLIIDATRAVVNESKVVDYDGDAMFTIKAAAKA